MALLITTWLWGSKYSEDDVAKLAAGFRRNMTRPYSFIVISDRQLAPISRVNEFVRIKDQKLIAAHCFCRLRVFDPEWQRDNLPLDGVDDRIVTVDLDTVITGHLDPLFDRPEPFVILTGANSSNPNPFCGALQMLRAGKHAEVWSSFSIEAAQKTKFHLYPDDQGWLWDRLPHAAGWKAGSSGVYAFQKPGWPPGDGSGLPVDARLVTFNGWRSPKAFAHLRWIQKHWSTW